MRFQNKVCLVTGAASGIGKATALQLAREGARIAVVDIDPEGSRTVQEICDTDGCAIFVQADVASSEQVQTAVKATVARWGRIDVLVNDAAVMTFTPILDLPDEEWDRVIAVNLRSHLSALQVFRAAHGTWLSHCERQQCSCTPNNHKRSPLCSIERRHGGVPRGHSVKS